MGDIKTYKCPNCDGAITFDATAQKMKCPYCKTEIDVASLVEYEDGRLRLIDYINIIFLDNVINEYVFNIESIKE